jgi:hypothetical protein
VIRFWGLFWKWKTVRDAVTTGRIVQHNHQGKISKYDQTSSLLLLLVAKSTSHLVTYQALL